MINNLEYYKVFYYVAKCGSLTAAATELAISQPAVSQSLKQLEEALGTRLCARVARGIRLTREGEALFPYLQRAYEELEAGERKLSQMIDLEYGELRIGASDMTLQFYLLPFLEKYHEKYPHIKVSVTNAPTPETLQLLKEKKIDFGVVSTPFRQNKEWNCFAVREIEDCFVAGQRFAAHKDKIVDLKELEKLPVISLEKNTSTRSYVDHYLKENKVEMNPEFELATSDMIVQFAVRNLGVGCVVKDFAGEYLKKGQLFELRFDKTIPKRQICVVAEDSVSMSRAAQILFTMMTEGVAN